MNKSTKILYIFCFFAVIVVMGLFVFHEKPFVYDARQELSYCMIDNYTYTSMDDPTAPVGITQEYSWIIENVPRTNGVVLFYFSHQEVEVTIDGALVYSLGINKDNYFSKGVGFGASRIPVYPEYEGKTISVKIRPVYKSGIDNDLTIYYGNYEKIASSIMSKDAPIIVFCSLCLIIGLVMLIFSIFKLVHKRANSETICMSIFAMFTGLWKLTDLHTMAFFIKNPLTMSSLSILSIPILVTSFVFYLCYQFSEQNRKFMTRTGIACCILSFVVLLLQITGVADVRQSIIISHSMIVFVIIFGSMFVIKEIRSGVASQKLKTAFIYILFCMFGTIMDIIIYYVTHHSYGTFLGVVAFFIYILYMGLLSLQEALFLIKQGKSAKHYKEIALHDELTGLYSRVFFKQYISEHQNTFDLCQLVMFDVNNLKQCNDTRGHSCGDVLLRDTAQLIEEAFRSDGKCIRLSGDEFCVILESKNEEDVKKVLSAFSISTQEYNENHPDSFPIHVAYGYASFDQSLDLDLNDTLKRADKKMYDMKHQMKQQMKR